MRIMIDTNILVSAIFFPKSQVAQVLTFIMQNHTVVLSSYVLDELISVTKRKFPEKKEAIEMFLANTAYEFVYTLDDMPEDIVSIRDLKDYPVIYTAIREQVDILITGDKDFTDIDIESPEIINPSEFKQKYM